MKWATLLEGNLHQSAVDTGHGFLHLSLFADLGKNHRGQLDRIDANVVDNRSRQQNGFLIGR